MSELIKLQVITRQHRYGFIAHCNGEVASVRHGAFRSARKAAWKAAKNLHSLGAIAHCPLETQISMRNTTGGTWEATLPRPAAEAPNPESAS